MRIDSDHKEKIQFSGIEHMCLLIVKLTINYKIIFQVRACVTSQHLIILFN
jgi:hypothetical protein